MVNALRAELLKLRRSRLPGLTLLAFTVAAGVGGLFMFIAQDPGRARSLGLLGAKAELSSLPADWPGYLALLAQIVAVGGLLVFGLVLIWSFGREFVEHTAKDLLALPTSRTAIVAAKFVAAGGWCLVLAGYTFAVGLLVGAGLRLPDWSASTATAGLGRILATAAMTVLIATPFALAASASRGYLAAVGSMFLALFAAQIIAAIGYGHLFPWSVPSLYAGVAGLEQRPAGILGVVLVIAVGLASVAATAVWWQRADHTG